MHTDKKTFHDPQIQSTLTRFLKTSKKRIHFLKPAHVAWCHPGENFFSRAHHACDDYRPMGGRGGENNCNCSWSCARFVVGTVVRDTETAGGGGHVGTMGKPCPTNPWTRGNDTGHMVGSFIAMNMHSHRRMAKSPETHPKTRGWSVEKARDLRGWPWGMPVSDCRCLTEKPRELHCPTFRTGNDVGGHRISF